MKQKELIRAIQNNNIDEVKKLIENHEADPNQADELGNTPLHWACLVSRGRTEIGNFLIDNGANPNQPNRIGQIPLHWACRGDHIEIVQFLIEKHRANPNQPTISGETPLHSACDHGNKETVQFLIKKGANVNQPDSSGHIPLHWACGGGYIEIAKLLIEKGVDVNQLNNWGNTPLHSACRGGYTETAKWLIDNGANLNQLNESGDTLRLAACVGGYIETAKWLIEEYGANLNQLNNSVQTPLHFACMRNNQEFREFLIENGAKVNDAMVSATLIPETMPHIRAADWCQKALAENTIYGEMPEGVDFQLLQKVMKGQLVEEGSMAKLGAFLAADNPIANEIRAGTFIADTTNAILEKHAKRLYKNILSGTPHDIETLNTLPKEMQEIVAKRVKELCLENGIASYEKADTALQSNNIPEYIKTEMQNAISGDKGTLEGVELQVMHWVTEGKQSGAPKDVAEDFGNYQGKEEKKEAKVEEPRDETLMDLTPERLILAEQKSGIELSNDLYVLSEVILPKKVGNHLIDGARSGV